MVCFLLCSIVAHADQSIRLAWDANEEPDVIGYNLYVKNHINADYHMMSEIREQDLFNPLFPETDIWGLDENMVYYFVVTAFTSDQESGHSNEVVWQYVPKPEPNDDRDKSSGGGCFISTLKGE
jgi:hypothetical protein